MTLTRDVFMKLIAILCIHVYNVFIFISIFFSIFDKIQNFEFEMVPFWIRVCLAFASSSTITIFLSRDSSLI